MLIDAHIHLDQYEEHEIPLLLEEAKHVIAVSTDLESCHKTFTLSRIYSKVKAAYGFHPEQTLPSSEEEEVIFRWIRLHADKMVAVGEVGLPYYLKQEKDVDYTPYISLLERFIVLAKELKSQLCYMLCMRMLRLLVICLRSMVSPMHISTGSKGMKRSFSE